MKIVDCVKPTPKDNLGVFLMRMNWVETRLRTMSIFTENVEIKVENEEDWEFVFVDAGNGKKVMSVF